ncbi:hypothetical protein OIV83_005792 [Microbotryomycetes sp. JL201]|nr:hypothetical protein OIV83_005792 [Microbotryomycetes sp. JL201]
MGDSHDSLRHAYHQQHMPAYEHQQHGVGGQPVMHMHSLHSHHPVPQPLPPQHAHLSAAGPGAAFASYGAYTSPSGARPPAANGFGAGLPIGGAPNLDAAYAYHPYQQRGPPMAPPSTSYGPTTYSMSQQQQQQQQQEQQQQQHSTPRPAPPQSPLSPPFVLPNGTLASGNTPSTPVGAELDGMSPSRETKPRPTTSTSTKAPSEPPVATKAKTRSSIACTNCRRQKMKCEGAREGLPCKRCAAAKIRCTYELGQGSRNRAVRAGVASGDQGESGACTPQRELPPPPSGLNDSASYERRLAALEVEMSVIRSLVSNVSPERYDQPAAGASPEAVMQDDQLVPRFGFPPSSRPDAVPTLGATSSCTSHGMHTHTAYQHAPVSSPSISLLLNPVPMPDMVRLAGMPKPRPSHRVSQLSDVMKRPKTEEADATRDMIGRGLITEEEALLCFDAYMATLNTPRDARVPEVQLSFEDIRTRSSFLLSVLISVGARAIAHSDSHRTAVVESVRLTQESLLLPSPSVLVVKALVMFSLYNGVSRYCGTVATTVDKLGLPQALLTLRDLPESERHSDKARQLALNGRIFLTTWAWSSLYTVCAWSAPVQPYPMEVITEQIDILRNSDYTETTLDALLQTHIESALFAHRAWNELGPGMTTKKQTLSDKVVIVDRLVKDMSDWMERRQDMQELFNGWGDHSKIRKSTPYHHNRLIFDGYVLQKLEEADSSEITVDVRVFIRAAVETLFYCIKFGTETRMWLHHATAAHYWAQIKVPAALRFLFICLRVVPDEICPRRVLDMLDGMERYLDRVNTPTITPLEIATAATLRVVIGEMREYTSELPRRDDVHNQTTKASQERDDADDGMHDAESENGARDSAAPPLEATEASVNSPSPKPSRPNFENLVTAEDVTRAIEPERGGDLAGSLESLRFDTAIWGIMLLE